ncbi:hypothetical protein [Nonomuraea angiospora]|uniref:hypothetical protein n=1 Tax=Nonomuraea angiospora TaxID=46172 RepID=UPI0029B7CA6F|nr:hypothetical protein [Nonomuraea angiospora]MDX3101477.1 hypothetical protein [Nonomuraea angiospora]
MSAEPDTESRARPSSRVGARLVLSLASGRVAFRVVTYGSGIILLAAWGEEDFNRYAAAAGPMLWLTGLVAAGPEKAALKLVPRSRRTRGDLVMPLRSLCAYLPVPFVTAVAVAVVVAPESTPTLWLAAAAGQIVLGCTLVAIALFRALGRPGRDVAHYLTLSAATAVAVGLTYVTRPSPVVYLAGLLALTAVLNTILVRGLPRYPVTGVRRARRLLAGTAVLMGLPEVLPTAATSLLYVELALTRHAGDSGLLFLALSGWSLLTAVSYFLQRAFQPATSLRVTGEGAVKARERAFLIARVTVGLTVVWLALAVTVLPTDLATARPLWFMAVFLLAHAPAHALASYSAFLLENVSATGLRTSAVGAATGTAAVIGTGALTVPLGGAPGAICALAAMELAVGLNIWLRLRSARRKPATEEGE